MVSKGGKNIIDYKYGIQCGLTGSLAACSAKAGLMHENTIYRHLDGAFQFSNYVTWIIRISFVVMMFQWNIKMLEFKLRSFAVIGSSMTCVVSFQSNYFFMVMYEVIFFQHFPNLASLIGSMFCVAGVFILKDQMASVDRDLQEKEEEGKEEGLEKVSNQTISTKDDDKSLSVNSVTEEKDSSGNFISMNNDRQIDLDVNIISTKNDRQIEFVERRDSSDTVQSELEQCPRMRFNSNNSIEAMCINKIDN